MLVHSDSAATKYFRAKACFSSWLPEVGQVEESPHLPHRFKMSSSSFQHILSFSGVAAWLPRRQCMSVSYEIDSGEGDSFSFFLPILCLMPVSSQRAKMSASSGAAEDMHFTALATLNSVWMRSQKEANRSAASCVGFASLSSSSCTRTSILLSPISLGTTILSKRGAPTIQNAMCACRRPPGLHSKVAQKSSILPR